MKTIERYVFGAFLSSFVLAFLILSFVLTIGIFVQIIGYVMDGVEMSLVGQFCLVSLPETLQWSTPLALLFASIFVFLRMSADSEIAAMRACGIHLLTVMKWPILLGIVCTALGIFINNEVVPRGHLIRRQIKAKVSVGAGLSVLEPGRVIDDFPGIKLYFGEKDGNWLYDIIARDASDPSVNRMITSEKALVTQNGPDINLELYNTTIDPPDAHHRTKAHFARCSHTIKNALSNGQYDPSPKDMSFSQLRAEIARLEAELKAAKGDPADAHSTRSFFLREHTSAKVELMKRFVFAMASICFVLVGLPLGISSQRKESLIGIAISLAIFLGYYAIVFLTLFSFGETASLHPEILIWLPVAITCALAVQFTRRHL